MKEEIKAYNNVLELIGNTPLIKLNKVTENLVGNFYAKVEAFNPGHSTKDRIALFIIEEAERRGILSPGDTIIETTSGNTGFSLAMVSIIKGYNCILAVSSKSSKDKIDMLRSLGAKVYVCPAHVSADDERSYYSVAKRLHEETKGSVYINQYFNLVLKIRTPLVASYRKKFPKFVHTKIHPTSSTKFTNTGKSPSMNICISMLILIFF